MRRFLFIFLIVLFAVHVASQDEANPCQCQGDWVDPNSGGRCGEIQNGCPAIACDDDSDSWCLITNPGCDEQEPSDGGGDWAYCQTDLINRRRRRRRRQALQANCVCMAEWHASHDDRCTTVQHGCEAQACDDDSPWCYVANPGCDGEKEGGWAYCTPDEAQDIPCSACTENGYEADSCGCGVCGSFGGCSWSCQPSLSEIHQRNLHKCMKEVCSVDSDCDPGKACGNDGHCQAPTPPPPITTSAPIKCQQCLNDGSDYCISSNRCAQRAVRGECNGATDHITGDAAFGAEGHPMQCPQECACDSDFPYCWDDDSHCYKSRYSWNSSKTACPGTCTKHYEGSGIERETISGCKCMRSWTHPEFPQQPCTDSCCNPDDDPQGDWCFVEAELWNLRCWFQNWGYCKIADQELLPSAKDHFTHFESGPCRGTTPDHNPIEWHTRVPVENPEECFQLCLNETRCKAVEVLLEAREPWPPVSDYCEIWWHEPLSTGPSLFYNAQDPDVRVSVLKSCFKLTSLMNSTLRSISPLRAYTAHLNLVCPNTTQTWSVDPELCRELCTEDLQCKTYSIRAPQMLNQQYKCKFAWDCEREDLVHANQTGWITYTEYAEYSTQTTAEQTISSLIGHNFTKFGNGPCRGIRPDHNPDNWYAELASADPMTCLQSCLDNSDCKAVEIFVTWDEQPHGNHCEIWSQEPLETGLDALENNTHRRACFKRSDIPSSGKTYVGYQPEQFSVHPNLICRDNRSNLGVYLKSVDECSEACIENQDCISYAFKSWNWCELSSSCVKAGLEPTAIVGWTTYVKTRDDDSELTPFQFDTPAFRNFSQFQEGPCRGDNADHNPLDWYTIMDHTKPEECFDACFHNPACKAVEIYTNALGFPVDEHCEVWSNVPRSTGENRLYPGNVHRTCFTRVNAIGDGPVLDTSVPLYSAHPKLSCNGKGNLGVAYTYSHNTCRDMCTENSECSSYTWSENWDSNRCVMSSKCTEALLSYTTQVATTYVKISRHTAMPTWGAFQNFSKFRAGPCRGYSPDHNPSSWYRTLASSSPEACFEACQSDTYCKALELYVRQTDGAPVGDTCELWMHEPRTTGAAYRYSLDRALTCFKLKEPWISLKENVPLDLALDPLWQAYSRHPQQWCLGRNELGIYDSYTFEMCKYTCTENQDCTGFEWLESGSMQKCQLSTTCVASELDVSRSNWTAYLKNSFIFLSTTTTTGITTTTTATATTTATTATTTVSLEVRKITTTSTTTSTTTTIEVLLAIKNIETDVRAAEAAPLAQAVSRQSQGTTDEGESNTTIITVLFAVAAILLLLVCCLCVCFLRARRQIIKQAADRRNESNANIANPDDFVVIGSPVTGIDAQEGNEKAARGEPVPEQVNEMQL